MKYSLRFIGAAAVVSLALPLIASAQTTSTTAQVAALTAQLQQLLAQVAALQGQVASNGGATTGTGVAAANCPVLSRTLFAGMSGSDVASLQQFLTQTGDYTYGSVTGYFGPATEAAVQHFQANRGVVSSGTPDTTGYGMVGPSTRAAIAGACSGTTGGTTGGSTAPVGGYIQVSPVSGWAPLTVSVRATVNTTGSCTGALYVLDWGDGTAQQRITVPAGDCAQDIQVLQHVYLVAGAHQITFSSGGHQSTAIVTVNGSSSYSPTGSSCGTSYGLPSETLTASPQSGASPLTVTFSGIVNSNDSGFCTTDRVDALDFGDGTYAKVQLPSTQGGWLQYSVTHTYTNAGGYIVRLHQGPITSNDEVGHLTVTVSAGSSTTHGDGETFSVSTTTGSAPFTVSFTGVVNSNDASFGTGDGYDYLDFGDGTMAKVQLPSSSGGWRNYTVAHTYSSAGGYVAKLHQGNLSSNELVGSSQLITVKQAASTASGYAIVSLTPGYNNNLLEVDLQFVVPLCAQYQIDWGDSSVITTATASCSSNTIIDARHDYSASGTYTIKLNNGSGAKQTSANVTIN